MNIQIIEQHLSKIHVLAEQGIYQTEAPAPFKEQGIQTFNPYAHNVFVKLETLMNMDQPLRIEKKDSGLFPYNVFCIVDEILFNALADDEDLENYPPLKKLAKELEKKDILPFDDYELWEDEELLSYEEESA